MRNSPLVSIVIPHYAHGEYLPESVASALAQTYDFLEVIVVDDADPLTRAGDKLASFADDRLRIFRHQENLGAAAARNTAIKEAKGSLILPLDSDDVLAPDYLEKTLPLLENPELGGVYTAVQTFGIENRIISEEWSVEAILKGTASALACMLYRKKIFDELGGYNTQWKVGEDSDFFLRAYRAGWRFERVLEALYHYRRHELSTWHIASSQGELSDTLKELAVNLAKDHKELYAEHLVEIVKSKEERYWELQDSYTHLHSEFHKLLALYSNLEAGIKEQEQKVRLSLAGRVASKLSRAARFLVSNNKKTTEDNRDLHGSLEPG